MRDDVKTEQQQPPWPFTCYAHQRGGPNDMVGDFSYDEVSSAQPNELALTPCIPASLVCFHKSIALGLRADCRLEHFASSEAKCASA